MGRCLRSVVSNVCEQAVLESVMHNLVNTTEPIQSIMVGQAQ